MQLLGHHKRAARYLLVGMTPREVAERMPPFTEKHIKQWRNDLSFKTYLQRLEAKYLQQIDGDIEHLRRSALARLQEIVEEPHDSPTFNLTHFEWAINKVFQITLLREKAYTLNQKIDVTEGHAATTVEEKAALKQLLKVSNTPERYMRQGEA